MPSNYYNQNNVKKLFLLLALAMQLKIVFEHSKTKRAQYAQSIIYVQKSLTCIHASRHVHTDLLSKPLKQSIYYIILTSGYYLGCLSSGHIPLTECELKLA